MPYITAFFMPRQAGDRPDVVPEGAVNFAFIGQFAESKQRDCIFTTEYSVRTPMEAVYTLLGIERGVPEVFNSTYDVRSLLAATGRLRDGKELDIPGPAFLRNLLMSKLDKTQIDRRGGAEGLHAALRGQRLHLRLPGGRQAQPPGGDGRDRS